MFIVDEEEEMVDVDLAVRSERDHDVDLTRLERLVLESDLEELHVRELEPAVRFLQTRQTVGTLREFGNGAESQMRARPSRDR